MVELQEISKNEVRKGMIQQTKIGMVLEEYYKRDLLSFEAKQIRKGDHSTKQPKKYELGWESFRNDPNK